MTFYQDVKELKEVFSVEEANAYLKKGWLLVKPVTNASSTATDKGVMQHTSIIYIMADKGDAKKPPEAPKSTDKSKSSAQVDLEATVKEVLGDDFENGVHVEEGGRIVRMDYKKGDEAKSRWGRINENLKKIGFEWISDKKESRWERKL